MSIRKRNNTYKKQKLTEKFALHFLLPFVYLIVLYFSEAPVIIFTGILSPLLYIFIFDRKIFSKRFVIFSFPVFLTGALIYSCLPNFQYQSFRFFHPNWTETEGRIIDYKIEWLPTAKRTDKASTATIHYAYNVDLREEQVYAPKAVIRYSGDVWNTENDIATYNLALQKQVQEYIGTKNYKILLNERAEPKLFMPLDIFNFRGSVLLQSLVIILKVSLVLAIFVTWPYLQEILSKFLKKS